METLFKIVASPFIFLYYVFLMLAGLIFPTTVVIFLSFASLISQPFIWIINKGLEDPIDLDFPLINASKYLAVNNLLGMTIVFWVPFYGVHIYWTEKRLII
jgi:hypothetical protein